LHCFYKGPDANRKWENRQWQLAGKAASKSLENHSEIIKSFSVVIDGFTADVRSGCDEKYVQIKHC